MSPVSRLLFAGSLTELVIEVHGHQLFVAVKIEMFAFSKKKKKEVSMYRITSLKSLTNLLCSSGEDLSLL